MAELSADLLHTHAVLDHKLAGKGLVCCCAITSVKGDPAALALFVPAEPAIGNGLRLKILKAAEESIVLWDFIHAAEKDDLDELGKGTEK